MFDDIKSLYVHANHSCAAFHEARVKEQSNNSRNSQMDKQHNIGAESKNSKGKDYGGKFSCSRCHLHFHDKISLFAHTFSTHDSQQGQEIKRDDILVVPLLTPSRDAPNLFSLIFKCRKCSKIFDSVTALDWHMESMHSIQSSASTVLLDLNNQKLTMNSPIKPKVDQLQSDIPGQKFRTIPQGHKFKCGICGTRFSHLGSVYMHMNNLHVGCRETSKLGQLESTYEKPNSEHAATTLSTIDPTSTIAGNGQLVPTAVTISYPTTTTPSNAQLSTTAVTTICSTSLPTNAFPSAVTTIHPTTTTPANEQPAPSAVTTIHPTTTTPANEQPASSAVSMICPISTTSAVKVSRQKSNISRSSQSKSGTEDNNMKEKEHSKKYPCSRCNSVFDDIKSLYIHACSVHERDNTHILVAAYTTRSSNNQNQEISLMFKCHVCEQNCDSISSLSWHMASFHRAQFPMRSLIDYEKYKCLFCGAVVNDVKTMYFHMTAFHVRAEKTSDFVESVSQKLTVPTSATQANGRPVPTKITIIPHPVPTAPVMVQPAPTAVTTSYPASAAPANTRAATTTSTNVQQTLNAGTIFKFERLPGGSSGAEPTVFRVLRIPGGSINSQPTASASSNPQQQTTITPANTFSELNSSVQTLKSSTGNRPISSTSFKIQSTPNVSSNMRQTPIAYYLKPEELPDTLKSSIQQLFNTSSQTQKIPNTSSKAHQIPNTSSKAHQIPNTSSKAHQIPNTSSKAHQNLILQARHIRYLIPQAKCNKYPILQARHIKYPILQARHIKYPILQARHIK